MSLEHIIVLDRDGGTYYAGEAIKGKVKVMNDPSENIDWFGACVTLVEHQILCDLERLWYYPYEAYDKDTRSYDFTLHIPNPFYSTSITICGKHSYYLKATFSYNDGGVIRDKISLKEVVIVRPLDLEQYDYIYNKTWELGFNSYILCKLDQGAYVPGQNVEFRIAILKSMRWKHIKVSIWQLIKTGTSSYKTKKSKAERNFHYEMIDSTTICSKNFKRGQSFNGLLKLPKGIALSTNYPIYRKSNLLYFRIVSVEYSVRIRLCRRFLKTIHLRGDELIVGTKPLKSEGAVDLGYDVEDPSNFCLEEDPKMVKYAYIPKPGIMSIEACNI